MISVILILLSAVDFKVSTITIEGNEHFRDNAIRSVMLTRTPSLFHRGYFVQDVFKGDIVAIKNLYNYNGFLEARVDYALNIDSTKKVIDIQIEIQEGKQTFVDTIIFTGNTLFDEDFLLAKITTTFDEPLDKRKIEVDNYLITSLYDDIGYADVMVSSEFSVSDSKASVVHTIVEGEKQFIEHVELEGLERTREQFVRNEIKLRPNDTFRYANILKSQRTLYNLGIFKSIRLQTQEGVQPNTKIVRFVLTEKEPIIINFRIGYGTQDYVRIGAGFTHLNMFGRAWRGQIEGKLSFAEYRLDSRLTFPKFILLPVKYSIGAFYQMKKEIGYRTRSIGGYNEAHFGLLGGRCTTKYDVENIRTYFTDEDSIENDWLHGVKINWLMDRRDDPLSTRAGNYINMNLETSGIIIPADVNYVRPFVEYRLFKPFYTFVGATAFTLGIVQKIAPSVEIPVYKRFYCGGTTSVRGYSERSIGPKDEDGNPLGGNILFEFSGEIRFLIYKLFSGVIFVDAGNVWREYENVSGALRWGAGAGLRINTPLGTVRLDYGIKLDRRTDEPFGALHFAIGEAF